MEIGVDGCDKDGFRVLANKDLIVSKFAGECARDDGADDVGAGATGSGDIEEVDLAAPEGSE